MKDTAAAVCFIVIGVAVWLGAQAPVTPPQAPLSDLPPVSYALGPDSQPQPGVPKGSLTETCPCAREVLSRHAAQLSGVRACPVRREPSDSIHDLPGRQRLCGRQRARAGGARQSDRQARAAADDGDVHRSRRHAGALRSGAESLRAHLRVRLADAAVRELPDRRADPGGREDLQPLEGSERPWHRRLEHGRRGRLRRGLEPSGSVSARHHVDRQLRQFQGRRSLAGLDSQDRAAADSRSSCRRAVRIWSTTPAAGTSRIPGWPPRSSSPATT